MTAQETSPPPATHAFERVLRPRHGWTGLNLRELWQYRELFWFLAWRDILVRYKQTYLGVLWALLQPLLIMVVFTVLFGKVGRFESKGAAYPVMTLAGLVPWLFFANAMSSSSSSLIASQNMITKVYFPRLVIPASAVLGGMLDFAIAVLILFGMMLWYGVAFTWQMALLPVFFLVAFLAAFGVGLWLSALNVKYRDVKYVVPFLVQMGLYASPVAFVSSVVAEKFGEQTFFWYSLNPMVGVIDGFRWCVLGPQFEPHWPAFGVSVLMTLVLLVTGALYFRNTEKTFADVI